MTVLLKYIDLNKHICNEFEYLFSSLIVTFQRYHNSRNSLMYHDRERMALSLLFLISSG